MLKSWYDGAWADYLYWQTQDRRTLRRINRLLEDIERHGYATTGQPEPLKGNLSGWWSVRINDQDRIVFRIRGDILEILQCRGHYDDR
jgi:toxin YoeB